MDRDGVFAVIVRSVREVVPELDTHSFQAGDPLKELGLDSAERSEVIVLTLPALGLAPASLAEAGHGAHRPQAGGTPQSQ